MNMPDVRPEGFQFEQPDDKWLARIRSALSAGKHDGGRTGSEPSNQECYVAGARLGLYELVRQIGTGGMGSVWLARRADGLFERDVAIKLIKRGMDTEAVIRRFRMERQVMASLVHPHIAGLYDAGSTPDGRPYLVMEYVEGLHITEFCDANHLDVDQRLTLFGQVCAAIHHAHSTLVLHRDLKPSNILVTPDGTPKLLDFGIAKLLSDDDAVHAMDTLTELRAMTPMYASPEQVLGDRLTTASDTYSLGVLLYELLTGLRPYQLESPARSHVEQAILEQKPRRPSMEIRRRDDLTPAARSRLSRRLRGNLDSIVMTALHKDPTQRYQSAEQLAEDVRRHLEGLPLLARRAGVVRRAIRTLRRHRGSVLIASIAALSALVISAAGVTHWLMAPRRAEHHLREAHLALLRPQYSSGVWTATFFNDVRMLARNQPPSVHTAGLQDALVEYDRALRLDSRRRSIRQERDTIHLALSINGTPGSEPELPQDLQFYAPLTCAFATAWARDGCIPELTDHQLDTAEQADVRSLGLLALLSGQAPVALRAWSRLTNVEADPLIESLLGVLHLSVERPELAYPRLLSAYRRYPECGFLCTYLADAALDCGDMAMARTLLERAPTLPAQDTHLGLHRVTMRYFLATGQDDRAAELFESKSLQSNPVAVVQYARHLSDEGESRQALALLGQWCAPPVNVQIPFTPYRVVREYLLLVQQWWTSLDSSQQYDVLYDALGEDPADPQSVFRILHEYNKCVQRLATYHDQAVMGAISGELSMRPELTSTRHREIMSLHHRLGIHNAYRWRLFRDYPDELRERQVQTWCQSNGQPATERIAALFEAFQSSCEPDRARPYVKVLPTEETGNFKNQVAQQQDLALIQGDGVVLCYRRAAGEWRFHSTLAPVDGAAIRFVGLDGDRAVLLCQSPGEAVERRNWIRSYKWCDTSLRWVGPHDQDLNLPGVEKCACADGIFVLAGVSPESSSAPTMVQILRWNDPLKSWILDQSIDDWGALPGRRHFLEPAIDDDVIAIGTMCGKNAPSCGATIDVYHYSHQARRWIRGSQLAALSDQSHLQWRACAIEGNVLAASAVRGNHSELYVFRRRHAMHEWELEASLGDLLPEKVARLGQVLDVEGDRITAAAGKAHDLYDYFTDIRVFEYDQSGQSWRYAGTAEPRDRAFGDGFGEHAICADTLIVTSPSHDAAGIDAGAAYIFDLGALLAGE